MDFALSDEERAVRDTARAFIAREVMPLEQEVLRRERAHRPGLERSELRELQLKARKFGFWGLATPEEYGGMNLPAVMQSLIWTELGRTFVPFRFGGEADNILFHASAEQQREFLLPTIEGERSTRRRSRTCTRRCRASCCTGTSAMRFASRSRTTPRRAWSSSCSSSSACARPTSTVWKVR